MTYSKSFAYQLYLLVSTFIILYQIKTNGMIGLNTLDQNFYERKLAMMEEDMILLQEQYAKAKQRLRNAQDYQIKYHILLKTSDTQIQKLRVGNDRLEEAKREEIISIKLKQVEQIWLQRNRDLEAQLTRTRDQQIDKLKSQLENTVRKASDLAVRQQEMDLFGFKLKKYQKENQSLNQQLSQIKIYYQKQKKDQISALRIHLNNNYKQKLSNIRNNYQGQIKKLQIQLIDAQLSQQQQIYKQPQSHIHQLKQMKEQIAVRDQELSRSMQQLDEQLRHKNQQIKKLIQQKSDILQKNKEEVENLKKNIVFLQNRLIGKQKDHENQIFLFAEHLKTAKDHQVAELKNQIQKLNQDRAQNDSIWSQKILNNDKQIQKLKNLFQQEKEVLLQDKRVLKQKLKQYANRLKITDGDGEARETQLLFASLLDFDNKEAHMGNYDNGITFLERQLKKCQLKLEQKTRGYIKLSKDMAELRTEYDRQLLELKQKNRKINKQSNERISQLQNEIQNLNGQLIDKQKVLKKIQKQRADETKQNEIQKAALKDYGNQVQKNYNRLLQTKKSLQTSYRDQREKSMASLSDLNSAKKQKWMEMEKMKNQLEIIFREKEEQIKLKYSHLLESQTNQINNLRQKHELSENQNNLLQRQNDRLMNELDSDKQNTKYASMNQKVATLNLQIALTQNLYDSLIKAKSRLTHSPAQGLAEIDHDDNTEQSQDPLLMMSFHPSSPYI